MGSCLDLIYITDLYSKNTLNPKSGPATNIIISDKSLSEWLAPFLNLNRSRLPLNPTHNL